MTIYRRTKFSESKTENRKLSLKIVFYILFLKRPNSVKTNFMTNTFTPNYPNCMSFTLIKQSLKQNRTIKYPKQTKNFASSTQNKFFLQIIGSNIKITCLLSTPSCEYYPPVNFYLLLLLYPSTQNRIFCMTRHNFSYN